MTRLFREHRLLSAILLWALVAGIWERTQAPAEAPIEESTARLEMLAESYPDEGRVLFTLGLRQLNSGDLGAAVATLGRAYDAGYKEDENLYSVYIDALVRTQSSRDRIAEVVARWKRDYPTSEKLVTTRERLRNAKVLL